MYSTSIFRGIKKEYCVLLYILNNWTQIKSFNNNNFGYWSNWVSGHSSQHTARGSTDHFPRSSSSLGETDGRNAREGETCQRTEEENWRGLQESRSWFHHYFTSSVFVFAKFWEILKKHLAANLKVLGKMALCRVSTGDAKLFRLDKV